MVIGWREERPEDPYVQYTVTPQEVSSAAALLVCTMLCASRVGSAWPAANN